MMVIFICCGIMDLFILVGFEYRQHNLPFAPILQVYLDRQTTGKTPLHGNLNLNPSSQLMNAPEQGVTHPKPGGESLPAESCAPKKARLLYLVDLELAVHHQEQYQVRDS